MRIVMDNINNYENPASLTMRKSCKLLYLSRRDFNNYENLETNIAMVRGSLSAA
jgi:hypothetical protein